MFLILGAFAWIWWAILGFLGVCLAVWGIYQAVADHGAQNVANRAAWLNYWFGETGARFWLENWENRYYNENFEYWKRRGEKHKAPKNQCWQTAKRADGELKGYVGGVRDTNLRGCADVEAFPPWGPDWVGSDPAAHAPRGCDWLAAGFWEPVVRHGKRIDPMDLIRWEWISGWRNPQGHAGGCPFEDKGKFQRQVQVEAMEMEAVGGAHERLWSIKEGHPHGRRTYWKGISKDPAIQEWIEHDGDTWKGHKSIWGWGKYKKG